MRADELCAAFGMSKSDGANKAKLIRDMFDMIQYNPVDRKAFLRQTIGGTDFRLLLRRKLP